MIDQVINTPKVIFIKKMILKTNGLNILMGDGLLKLD